MNSTDNNIIALVELALYNAFGEINFRELVNSEKEEDKTNGIF